MAIPPFNDLRLLPGEESDPRRLRELFEGVMRNFEDLYNRYATSSEVKETVAKRTIAGSVTSAGTVFGGTEFTSEKTATGTYKISLKTELTSPGIIVPGLIPGTEAQLPLVSGPAKKVFTVLTGTAAALKDGSFNFIIRQL